MDSAPLARHHYFWIVFASYRSPDLDLWLSMLLLLVLLCLLHSQMADLVGISWRRRLYRSDPDYLLVI